nr:hydroxyacylglutathione hydrolase [uncultured Rhodoferax sp.]
MTLLPLPALTDNYIWMLHNGQEALVVDPGEAQPVLEALERESLTLHSILVTHHHGDHTGGVPILREATGAKVWGPAHEKMPEPIIRLVEGDRVETLGIEFTVMDVPGHTAGHIAFFGEPGQGAPLLFCGDTLFSAGCGRLFEGTPVQMQASLQKLARLPDNTQVCCTHEYTLGNVRFALVVEPSNQALIDYDVHCRALRAGGAPTLPSNMRLERNINPFLRTHLSSVADAVQSHDAAGVAAAGVFAALRQWKNTFQ